MSDEARDRLGPALRDIRTAAEDQQPEVAAARLAELRTTVTSLVEQGEISEERANEILAAADAVEAQLAPITTTRVPSFTRAMISRLSARLRSVRTCGRSAPGMGSRFGSEPVAISSAS